MQLGGCDIVGHQESRRSHLAIDVPVQGGRGEGVEGGAVGRQGVSWIVGWQGTGDDWTLLWQINNYEDIGVGGRLEEGGLAGDLASELAAGGEVHVAENYPRLRGLVFVYNKSCLSKHHSLWPVSGDVSVEFLTISIPFYRVQ